LQAKSQTGDVTDAGKPITVERFADWAKANLSSSVKELADAVFGSDKTPPLQAAGGTAAKSESPTPAAEPDAKQSVAAAGTTKKGTAKSKTTTQQGK
jgi:hypothetical protein